MTQDMRSGKCALCGHDEVWQAPIKFSVVEPGQNTSASDNAGLLTTLVCAKCGHLQWFMENVASWRSTMLETGQAPKPKEARRSTPSAPKASKASPPKNVAPARRSPTAPEADTVPADTQPPLSASAIETDPAPAPSTPKGPASQALAVPAVRPTLEESGLFDVLLLSAEDVESEVAHTLESLGLASSKAYALAFATPTVVAEAIPQLQAERFRIALLASGAVAKIELVESNVSVSEVPAAEVRAAEVPAAEVRAAEVPAAEVLATEVPAAEVRAAEVPAAEAPVGGDAVNGKPSRSQVSQPPPSVPVCRGCGKPVAHHQIMITQKGQMCADCYRELEALGGQGA
ncbi:MAG: hypothetical protein SFV15_13995 [Polyangiaceae bacterium]|nr:hypothetical protein [Polyangiaceae bacterium]